MNWKGFPAWLAMLLLAALIVSSGTSGCGGGGGGGGGGGNGGGGGAVVLSPASGTVGPNGMAHMVARANGVNVDVTWSATAGFVQATGIGTAIFNAPASGTATVTATRVGGSSSDSSTFTVVAGLATVSGRIVDSSSLTGISGVIVDFYEGGVVVASATTIPNGYFSTGVPPTATRFHVRSSSVSSFYYRQYTFNTKRYEMTIPSCTAPLPALVAGGNANLATTIGLTPATGPPPPPPNGCS